MTRSTAPATSGSSKTILLAWHSTHHSGRVSFLAYSSELPGVVARMRQDGAELVYYGATFAECQHGVSGGSINTLIQTVWEARGWDLLGTPWPAMS